MSVINTMLKDLERRGADGASAGDNILGGLSSGSNNEQGHTSSNKAYWLSITIVAVISVVVAGVYYISPYRLVAKAESRVKPVASSIEQSAQAGGDQTSEVRQLVKPVPYISSAALAVQSNDAQATPSLKSTQAQKAPLPLSTPVATVKPVVSETPVQKNITAKPVAVRVDHAKSAQPLAEDDVAETTDESLRVVTKQQRAFTPAEKSQKAYAAAVTLYDQGRRQEAKTSLIQSLALNPGNIDACRLLTVVYLDDGRADLAEATVSSGIQLHDTDQNLLRLYVQTLVKQKKYGKAIAVMGQRIQLTSPEDLGYLAGLYQKNSNHLEAVKYYAEALQLVPSKSVWWLGQGISLEILQQYKEAVESYKKSVSTGELSTSLMQYSIKRINVIKRNHPDLES